MRPASPPYLRTQPYRALPTAPAVSQTKPTHVARIEQSASTVGVRAKRDRRRQKTHRVHLAPASHRPRPLVLAITGLHSASTWALVLLTFSHLVTPLPPFPPLPACSLDFATLPLVDYVYLVVLCGSLAHAPEQKTFEPATWPSCQVLTWSSCHSLAPSTRSLSTDVTNMYPLGESTHPICSCK